MIVAPAVDLRGGRCVQLVGGRPEDERVSLPDPVAVARGWRDQGFPTLHVVDLDAALGSGDNADIIRRIIEETGADVQVGGGIRSSDRAKALIEAGAARLIIGTRALDDPEWLAELASVHPGAVIIALDTRDGVILRKGWTEATGLRVEEYLPELADLPLAGVLSTDVGREGRLKGIDREGCTRVIEASPHPVWISGGITTADELDFLDRSGAGGVVLGMAVYTGALDTEALVNRWGSKTNEDEA
ncbi:MAG: 1-(5-phosphoribosyl)-5-[(5-phosphoribosylamino)methylideneamino] imidazole-4-carboxamide isomerase [Gemmatimonadetes bacterium]|nr:1-(5-phosphoribosyl)-5-[(5-phosphoribosylamino)methylideneamino] imidazole-4-carboxamide isomerase [Gemmatimonadota bacterium]NNF13340.1 1-(5-phosphoribosyl)-5-[(5-phosphoribosylamino)methylideneamino] imidazole-4-carboxamide isomerase [Gemmatimonadota bacterium]NNL29803.1 1-(5-phosphoribosyl)-5-[(5-phosphoribosylamino)methylideneamino] imidazole-4-carboxamide isomerase [Gemmatimonadota bacterium]